MFHVVTPFPFFLDYGFYAPLILRITLGLYALAIGFSAHHKNVTIVASESTITETRPELTPVQMVYRGLFILAGISFIIGYYTQISAIVVVILMLVSIFDKRARITPEVARVELTLLIIIALSILVLGAGPFAIDLPL
jgi:uncharacterized membrane protein YphA (DoxX/SURF4 family)